MNPGIIIIVLFVFLLCISSAVGVYMYMEKQTADEAEKAEEDRLQAIEDSKVTTRYDVGTRDGPAQSNLVCPEGAFITDVYGKSTEFLDNFGAKCSDGTDLGAAGSGRGEPYTITSDSGFSKIQASNPTSGWGLRTVSFFNEGVKLNENPLGYTQGGELYFTDCKNTETGGAASGKIVGFKLGHGDAIERIQLVCEKKELP